MEKGEDVSLLGAYMHMHACVWVTSVQLRLWQIFLLTRHLRSCDRLPKTPHPIPAVSAKCARSVDQGLSGHGSKEYTLLAGIDRMEHLASGPPAFATEAFGP